MTLTRRSLLTALGTLPLTRLAHGQAAHRITLLHMNDFHSRHLPVDGRAISCGPGREGCFGGSARLATAIRAQRAAAESDGRAVLLLDGGDQFQGSLFFTAHRGMAELAVMHSVGTDAMAVGNHEFDLGPDVLGRFAEAARFPVLSANVDVTDEPALAGRLRRYAMFDRAGLRIAVVGLTTRDAIISSSPGPNVRISDAAQALELAATEARADGATLVIALSHLGVFEDRRLTVPGIAAILGGHSHSLLSNVEPGAIGPHPEVARSGALIVQAGAYGRYLGRLDLDIGADGRVLAHGGECRHVGLDVPEDPAVAAIVATYNEPLAELRGRPVAVLPEDLGIAACRVAQCNFGRLVAVVLLAAAPGANMAVTNGGGLRTGLRAGPVSYGDILEAMPFGNTLATVTLTGADLRATLEHGLSHLGRGGFPQLAGAALEWDATRPAGERIKLFKLQDLDGGWYDVDPARRYIVATNNFMRSGGDGYTILRDRGIDPYDDGTGVAELVIAALAK